MNIKWILLLLFISTSAHAESERFYQEKYCPGELEVVLPDKSRIDCETSEYAIEFDFAKKWAEAIGQSLHYARLANKKAGTTLIVEAE